MSSLRARHRTANSRALAADAAVASVFIGAPAHESFTDSVFDNALHAAVRFRPQVTGMDDFRKQLIDFLTRNATETNHSLDIVADAPSGRQRMAIMDGAGTGAQATLHPLIDLLSDPHSSVDDDLVTLIRGHFVQCRLLGCVTAVEAPVRDAVKTMAKLLQMPMFGTTRTIAFTDFTSTDFIPTQIIDNAGGTEEQSKLDIITPSPVLGEPDRGREHGTPAHGSVQQAWLDAFPQVKLTHDHLLPPGDPALSVWPVDFELIGRRLATTDVIRTAPLAVTTLRSPSGTICAAEVLARGTLLRLPATRGSPIYINVALDDPVRQGWLSLNVPGINRIPLDDRLR